MNANELADELENTTRHRNDPLFAQAAAMLRQQQAARPIRDLTTEEIKEIAIQHIEMRLDGDRFGYFEFAKAVLKKAQEENNAKS